MDRKVKIVQKARDGEIVFEVKDIKQENANLNSHLRKEYFNISEDSVILAPSTSIIESDKSLAEDSTILI